MELTPRVNLLSSDETLSRDWESLLPNTYSVTRFSSREQFLSEAELHCPGCLVIDQETLPGGGVDVHDELYSRCSELKCVFVLSELNLSLAVHLLNLGTTQLLQKPVQPELLQRGVANAIATSTKEWIQNRESQQVGLRLGQLNEEEVQVMELMIGGKSVRETEELLVMSRRTVNRRRRTVLEKMQVDSVAELCLILGRTMPDGVQLRADSAQDRLNPNSF